MTCFKVLMESCLSFDPESRPSFSIIVNVLKSIQDKPEKKESEKGTLNPLKLLRRSIGFSVVGTARDSMRQSSARQRRTHRPKRSVDTQKSKSSSNIRATFSIHSHHSSGVSISRNVSALYSSHSASLNRCLIARSTAGTCLALRAPQ